VLGTLLGAGRTRLDGGQRACGHECRHVEHLRAGEVGGRLDADHGDEPTTRGAALPGHSAVLRDDLAAILATGGYLDLDPLAGEDAVDRDGRTHDGLEGAPMETASSRVVVIASTEKHETLQALGVDKLGTLRNLIGADGDLVEHHVITRLRAAVLDGTDDGNEEGVLGTTDHHTDGGGLGAHERSRALLFGT